MLDWICALNLEMYTEVFRQNDVDGFPLLELTESDLKVRENMSSNFLK